MAAVGRGGRAVWRCGLVKNTSRDLNSYMAWWIREDYVTRLEQFMARFNTSVRVIYIPIHMISDETINVMYQYVRR